MTSGMDKPDRWSGFYLHNITENPILIEELRTETRVAELPVPPAGSPRTRG